MCHNRADSVERTCSKSRRLLLLSMLLFLQKKTFSRCLSGFYCDVVFCRNCCRRRRCWGLFVIFVRLSSFIDGLRP